MSKRLPLLNKIFVSVDSVIFAYHDRKLYLPLFRRRADKPREPFPDHWSLPGGPLLERETLEDGCRRKLEEDIGLEIEYMEQLYTFGAPDRDPRERAISVSYFALIRWPDKELAGGADVGELRWFELKFLPSGPFAFDHREIIETAIIRLRGKLQYQPIGLNLMADEFSIADLKALYDTVLDRDLDKRNFVKKLLSFNLLVPTRKLQGAKGRPTQLYRFDPEVYERLQRGGFSLGA